MIITMETTIQTTRAVPSRPDAVTAPTYSVSGPVKTLPLAIEYAYIGMTLCKQCHDINFCINHSTVMFVSKQLHAQT